MLSMTILARSRPLIKLYSFRSISTIPFLSQESQLAEPPFQTTSPLPPNPASGSPLYNENWRNPQTNITSSLLPLSGLGLYNQTSGRIQSLAETLDMPSLMNMFADWMTLQQWGDMKQLFESWIRALDIEGKPNKPDVNLYNHYLRANLMIGSSAGELLDLVAQMDDYRISPNTATFNLVLKAMHQAKETEAAQKLLERMQQSGQDSKESLPDDESYHLVVTMLFSTDQIDLALKYIDMSLKSGYMLSMSAFTECVRSCVNQGRLNTLVSIIERCKKMAGNKALCPPWNLCNYIADIAIQADNSELAYYALESMAKWIVRGESTRPPVLISVDEGLIVSALGTASRTCSSKLLDGSWAILKRSLRQTKLPNPETYLGKIYAHSSLGNLPKAFSTLHDLESIYGKSIEESTQDIFSPFTSLNPLVEACSCKGFATLDSVYYQLENLSKADPPYKSLAALNCVILGCANIWDVDRAYQTFISINSAFELTPNIHSYNALISAYVKLGQRDEAVEVFKHFVELGVKPNEKTYALLIDANLVTRDLNGAISVITDMVSAGYEPSKETLKKVRRRCVREIDDENNDKVEALAKDFNIRMGTESRRNMLFNLQYSTDYPR